jgi:hypothetical protein
MGHISKSPSFFFFFIARLNLEYALENVIDQSMISIFYMKKILWGENLLYSTYSSMHINLFDIYSTEVIL